MSSSNTVVKRKKSPAEASPTGTPVSGATPTVSPAPREHWPQSRPSYLTDNFKDAVFNFIVLFLIVWIGDAMYDCYLVKGVPIDYRPLWLLLKDLPVALVINVVFFVLSLLVYPLVRFVTVHRGFSPLSYVLYSLLQTLILVGPPAALWWFHPNWQPLSGAAVTAQAAVNSMKIHSYFFTYRHIHEYLYGLTSFDRDIGDMSRLGLEDITLPLEKGVAFKKYLGIVQFRYLATFLKFPTLCFFLSYPASQKIRWRMVFLHIIQTVVALHISYIALIQVSVEQWHKMMNDPVRALIKTMIPCFICWMTFFFGTFHGMLNMLAELTGYEDRKFYGPWWEAANLELWWRDWNCSVTNWMRRHIYFQSMQDAKFPRQLSNVTVFLVSALWHEYVLMFAFKSYWPILGIVMMAQVAFMRLTNPLKDSIWGNMIVWFSFIMGWPVVLNMYAFTWCLEDPPHCSLQSLLLLHNNIITTTL